MKKEPKPWVVAVDGIEFTDAIDGDVHGWRLLMSNLWKMLSQMSLSKSRVTRTKGGWLKVGSTHVIPDNPGEDSGEDEKQHGY